MVVLEWLKISRQNGFEKQVETLEIKRANNVVYFGFLTAVQRKPYLKYAVEDL